jgi:hypothetical protein
MIEFIISSSILILLIPKFINMYMNYNFKIPICKKYYARFYNGVLSGYNKEIHDNIKTISINSVGEIAPYSIMEGENFNEKKFIIIYDKNNNPVGMNCFFDWKYKSKIITHLGLYLIDEKHKGNSIQKYITFINLLYNISNYKFRIYFSDIGNSPSAWKGIDKNSMTKKCYPSLKNKYNKEFEEYSKESLTYFYNNYSNECGISENSNLNQETMCISNANSKGGFSKLVEFQNNRNSKENNYNNKMKEYCPNNTDVLMLLCKINIM